MDDQAFQLLFDRLQRLEDKVDLLLGFKWQIVGGSVVISIIFSVALQVILSLVGAK